MKIRTVLPDGLMENLAGEGYKTKLDSMLNNQKLFLDVDQYCRETILLSISILLPRKIFKKKQEVKEKAKSDMQTAELVSKRVYQFIKDNQSAVSAEIAEVIERKKESDKRFFFGKPYSRQQGLF